MAVAALYQREIILHGQISKQTKDAKYISKFWIYGAKVLDKTVQKRNFYNVLFCKFKLSIGLP